MPYFSRLPLEPIMKLFVCSLGLFEEAFLDYNDHCEVITIVYHIRKENGELNNLEKLYHISMYSCFLVSGVVDLLSQCTKLPWPTSMLFLSLAFVAEGVMFYFHTMGRDSFNIVNHQMLVYTITSCIIFSLLRLYSPSNLIINLGLGSSMLFQGTWLIQIGYYLFGSFLGNGETITHSHVMLVTSCFMWHMLLIAVGALVLWLLCSHFQDIMYKNKGKSYVVLTPVGWKDSTKESRRLIVTGKNMDNDTGLERAQEECP